MSKDSKPVETTDADTQNPHPEDQTDIDATAEAVAEAAEALAGSEGDDSLDSEGDGESAAGDATKIAAERDRYRDAALRAQAELENYRKRISREAEQSAKYMNLPLIRELLPALDNLNRTVQAAEQTGKIDDLIQGLQMILGQVDQVFGNHSVKPITAVGEAFDPNLHEAIQQIPTAEHPPMTVIQEVEKGYTLHERVIRPSKVLVACAPPEPQDDSAK